MGLATSQYDILLNTKGYLLIEESRRKRLQQPFNPRFSTGDPGLGDLSFWQFQGYDAGHWDGGQGQDLLATTNKTRQSCGWDLRGGQFKDGPALSLGSKDVTLSAGTLTNIENLFNLRGKMIFTGEATSGTSHRLLLIGKSSAAGNNPGTLTSQTSDDSQDPLFYRVDSIDAEIIPMSGTPNGHVLAVFENATNAGPVNIDGIRFWNHRTTSIGLLDDGAGTNAGMSRGDSRVLIPIDSTHLMIAGGTSSSNVLWVYTLDPANANRYTAVTKSEVHAGQDFMAATWAVDSSGTFYIMTQGSAIPGAGGSNALNHGQVYAISATDALLAAGPRVTTRYTMPAGFYPTGLTSVGGTIYILGAYRPTTTEQYAAIIDLSGNIIWRSFYSYVGEDNYIRAYHRADGLATYFVVQNNLTDYASIMRIRNGGIVEEVCSIPKWTAGTFDIRSCAVYGSRLYWYRSVTNKYQSTNDVRGALDSSGTSARLELSRLGGNTPLIQKSAYKIIIETSAAIDTGKTLDVYVNSVLFGQMSPSDGTRKELTATAEFTSNDFLVELRIARSSVWTGFIKKVILQYVPTQFKKKAFSIGIRATRHLRLIDGRGETKTPATMISDLWTAAASNIPITYEDIDGTSYTVLVTDIDEREPLIDRQRGLVEALCFLELLEV